MVAVEGTAPIDRIKVTGNGVVIHTYEHANVGSKPNRAAFGAEIENTGVNQSQTSRYYYVRAIQTDEHLAWSIPIWIDLRIDGAYNVWRSCKQCFHVSSAWTRS